MLDTFPPTKRATQDPGFLARQPRAGNDKKRGTVRNTSRATKRARQEEPGEFFLTIYVESVKSAVQNVLPEQFNFGGLSNRIVITVRNIARGSE